jgi:DNA-binding CsgD family transcriptional regulator
MVAGNRSASAPLTLRERAVAEQLLSGKANKEIAAALGCSRKTVEFHTANVFRKTGVTSRLEFACRALAIGSAGEKASISLE